MADKTFRFLIIGAGGVGSWLAPACVRMLEYAAPGSMLVIVDGDQYEEKNKERQNFRGAGNKAEVLAAELAPEFLQTMVIPMAKWVVSELPEEEGDEEEEGEAGKITAKRLLKNGDVVYAVVDNFKARKDICDAAAEVDDIDVFLGGNDEGLYGSVQHYRRRNGKDVTEHPAVRNPEIADPADRNPGDMSCAERAKIEGGTQFIASNFGVAAWLLGRTQEVILNDGNMDANNIYFDLGLGMAQAYDRRVEVAEEKELVAT